MKKTVKKLHRFDCFASCGPRACVFCDERESDDSFVRFVAWKTHTDTPEPRVYFYIYGWNDALLPIYQFNSCAFLSMALF